MNIDSFNKVIAYIEDNLENEIDYKEIENITAMNEFIFERIFTFLTGMTIKEYIKKRRLSKAFEEIKNTDKKIIDIAFKYQYNSATSFCRSFKQLFNITPTECRKKTGEYKIFPIEYFENNKFNYKLDYEIKQISEKTIYCYHISSNNYNDFLYKVKELYKNGKKNNNYYEFNKKGMYGIYYKEKKSYHYLLGSEKCINNLEVYKIQKGKYVVFTLPSREQKDIVELEKRINKQWIPSTNYNVEDTLKIEYYNDNICCIWLKVA